ncbi:hypothetical protein GDO81_022549 [Engystomops pustulosus]|uniref:Uncharacterized protein n=1 Tax=Engystomops pustulosus TaxID=76066 RepID=A0AAV6Z634_ENGPU|nr:hypothetical protein GDO81_022549 [Engystomops pustulosus]
MGSQNISSGLNPFQSMRKNSFPLTNVMSRISFTSNTLVELASEGGSTCQEKRFRMTGFRRRGRSLGGALWEEDKACKPQGLMRFITSNEPRKRGPSL